MTNLFEGKTVAWLLERRSAIQDALARAAGSQTQVGLAPGMQDQFDKLTQEQIKTQLRDIRYALFCADPDNYSNPNKDRVMKILTSYGN
jgi:hypothetical protein